jgi:hypothetical protein
MLVSALFRHLTGTHVPTTTSGQMPDVIRRAGFETSPSAGTA